MSDKRKAPLLLGPGLAGAEGTGDQFRLGPGNEATDKTLDINSWQIEIIHTFTLLHERDTAAEEVAKSTFETRRAQLTTEFGSAIETHKGTLRELRRQLEILLSELNQQMAAINKTLDNAGKLFTKWSKNSRQVLPSETISQGEPYMISSGKPYKKLESYSKRADVILKKLSGLPKSDWNDSLLQLTRFWAVVGILGIVALFVNMKFFDGKLSAGCLPLLGWSLVFGGLIAMSEKSRRHRCDTRSTLYSQLSAIVADAGRIQRTAVAEIEARKRDAEREQNARMKSLEDECKQQLDQNEQEYLDECKKLREASTQRWNAFDRNVEGFREHIESIVPAWVGQTGKRLPEWPSRLLPLLCFGKLTFEQPSHRLTLPAIIGLPMREPLLIFSSAETSEAAVAAMQSILLHLLMSVPPGKLRFLFLDPVGLGQSAAPFLRLLDHDEELVGARVWVEPQHIEQRLVDLSQHMENVIQKYLRNEYPTIEAFNHEAGEVAEPYRVLVVVDFPAGFGEDTAQRLLSIAKNGPHCGVHLILLWNRERPLPSGIKKNTLTQSSIVFDCDQRGNLVLHGNPFQNGSIAVDPLPPVAELNHFLDDLGREARAGKRVEVPLARILQRSKLEAENWWEASTATGLEIPLGPIGARAIQQLVLGPGTAQHVLVGGKTGSGKSTLLHVLIIAAMLKYPPRELELYLIDFKKGVEFKIYANHRISHARVIAIESEREFGLSVLGGLDSEMTRRGERFRAAGVDNLHEYRQVEHSLMPRIVLLIDEYQELFSIDDHLANQASAILDRLVRQGRAFGMHVVLGSQSLAGSYSLGRSTVDQIAVRIALQCSEADSRLLLSADNPAARLLTRPGEAIYNAANGLIEGNNLFQVAWLSESAHEQYLQDLEILARTRGLEAGSPLTFEGNAPAQIETCRPLREQLSRAPRTVRTAMTSIWLGEPIAIKETTVVRLQRQGGNHLLILGRDEERALGLMIATLASLAAISAAGVSQIFLIDFAGVNTPGKVQLVELAQGLPNGVRIGQRRHLSEILESITTELEKRLTDDRDQSSSPIYLLIFGLQRVRQLEGGAVSFNLSAPTATPTEVERFIQILREGADLGIHCVAWCDSLANLHRRLGHQIAREFALRVALQMSKDDSIAFIQAPTASGLGRHRAILYNDEDASVEKFRPFAVPRGDWVQEICAELALL